MKWAEQTFQLVRVIIVAFALVAALPYVPFGESDSFKQVGFLFGILVSLGSTSVIGNVMAGTVLTYTNAFKIGDRIKIADCVGDVQEKSMFVTRIRTTKNEIISIPNGAILNTNITNFSAMGKVGQLIVHSDVTIGYEQPWRKIHELLIEAALASDGIVPEPRPFVLQSGLSDFSVVYQINAYSDAPNRMQSVYSSLHANIQDKLNAAGVEIMSPHYYYLRDGNRTTIPAEHLPKDYQAPPFVVSSTRVLDFDLAEGDSHAISRASPQFHDFLVNRTVESALNRLSLMGGDWCHLLIRFYQITYDLCQVSSVIGGNLQLVAEGV